MININKKTMTTTAIGLIIISSFLFFIQNIENKKDNKIKIIQEEIPQINIGTKTEIKIKDPVVVKKTIPKQEEIKELPKKTYKPEYPDFEVFEQSEAPKEGKYTNNFNEFSSDFQKVKIRSDGIVPVKNEVFSLENPQSFDSMYGYTPGVFYLDFLQKDITESDVISTLESISGVEVVKVIKRAYSYTIFFNVSNLTQREIYELEKNIKASRYIQYIEKEFIIIPKYNTAENNNARNQYNSNLTEY